MCFQGPHRSPCEIYVIDSDETDNLLEAWISRAIVGTSLNQPDNVEDPNHPPKHLDLFPVVSWLWCCLPWCQWGKGIWQTMVGGRLLYLEEPEWYRWNRWTR